MDMSDRELDDCIRAALKPHLSQQRKQLSRERVLGYAQYQTISPAPLAEKRGLLQYLRTAAHHISERFKALAVEEICYERARQNRYHIRYSVRHHEGRIGVQMLEPLRFSLMTPVF